MIKTSSLTLIAAVAVAVGGLSLPALAEDDSGTSFDDDLVAAALAERGYDVSQLNEVFGKIQATIRLADGSSAIQLFDPVSLQPIDGNAGGNTRVLTDLDVGLDREPVATFQSLVAPEPDED